MAKRLLKFGMKASILTGAVYFTIDQGIWEDTNQADKVYAELYTSIVPYFKEVPIDTSDIPSSSELSASSKFYYNQGVIAAGNLLKNLPSNTGAWIRDLSASVSSLLEASKADIPSSSTDSK